ncbi:MULTISPECIES: L-threonine 3-dehydrogenase [unclassified Marinitoga]|uniref:L-threonine 3-dehydrogenase n=1 Tax=unclassified Marinitoga TaxID=2640159 RepID=UPI00064158E4|nr:MULTISPECIES: L-threonine 3-dehydrogenase [unclassified Marinitoga]KLO23910.1 L-threonine 3-dehydrogenase [Marinitoga sp. 1155]NUU99190.1 L-threonine 3-dehydrogenase [Marinitoga sp. 1154]
MKAIIKKEPGKGFVLDEVEIPKIKNPDDVKIKVLNASICGTDLHIWKWDEWSQERIKTPQIDGHEFVGEVVEVGSMVKGVKPGDIVAAETHIPCGVCKQCKTGNMHVCKNMKILGVDRDGVFAEYVVVPEIVLWKLDPSIPKEFASVMEPLGNAIHTVTSVDLRGKSVLITGAGPIGAIAIQIAKISGAATVIVSEISEYRINMAKEMGADYIINPLEKDLVKEVMNLTNNDGVDVLLEMSGNPDALNKGIESLTNAGEVAILGVFPTNPVPFVMNTAVFKGIKIHCITGRKMFETWQIASEWLRTKRVDLSKLITHILPMEDFEKGFELMNSKKSGKIILKISE